MNRSLASIVSPPPHREYRMLRLPPLAAVACLFACSGPPENCSVIRDQELFVGQHSLLQPCFIDPEGGPITLSVSSSNPEVATAAKLGAALRVEAVSPGSATVTVTATDSDGMTAEDKFGVYVTNRPPQACGPLPQQELFVRHSSLVRPCFEDPDGQAFTLSASSSDAEVATAAVEDLDIRVTAVSPGTATVTVMATDPGGLSASIDFEVTVVESGPGD